MSRPKQHMTATLIAMVALVLVACGQTPAEANSDFLIRDARVQEVSVIFLETYPVQVMAEVKGYLPDGCTSIHEIEQTRKKNLFRITITTSRPRDVMCTMAIREFKEIVPLDTTGLAAGAYRVEVNGVGADFKLP